MKVLVLSDSHGRLGPMLDAVEQEQPDHIFFLGDHLRDSDALADLYPKIPMSAVRGNCDWGVGPDELLVELAGVRFFLTHGHMYGVKNGLARLAAAGHRAGAAMVCYGHTHQAGQELSPEGVWLFNPGTVGGLRARAGYGVLTAVNGTVSGELR